MKGRKRGAPAMPRAECPSCHKLGLGNLYRARVQGGSRPYRQCRYCGEIAWWDRDARARRLEAEVNAKLAELHPAATYDEVAEVVRSMVPETWEWLETTSVGRPPSIGFIRYGELP